MKIDFKKLSLSIGQRVLVGNLVVILIAVVSAAVSFLQLYQSQNVINYSFQTVAPSLDALNTFSDLVVRSQMYTTNWIYTPENESDKVALRDIQNQHFPLLRTEISNLKREWRSEKHRNMIDSIVVDFDAILERQQKVMRLLDGTEDYLDGAKKEKAISELNQYIIPTSNLLTRKIALIIKEKNAEKEDYFKQTSFSFWWLEIFVVSLGVVVITMGLTSTFLIYKTVSQPIKQLNDTLLALSLGKNPVLDLKKDLGKHEIGQMYLSTQKVVTAMRTISNFATAIGKGQYDSNFTPLSQEDVLGNALLEMRDNLVRIAEDEKRRRWITEGIAQFSEIIRVNYEHIEDFAFSTLRQLVKYTGANQGSVFLIDEQKEVLYVAAAFAWDKQKFLTKNIRKGEGLTGQAWQEGQTLYFTDVPSDFINITSGLGEATPDALLIVPLKSNQVVYGVIEMAFFGKVEGYKIEFIERISESFASTISSVQSAQQTKRLLQESQMMAEQMRAQEEEMRQNVEELQATQEAMQRKSVELESQLNAINAAAAMLELNPRGLITQINDKYLRLAGYEYKELLNQPYTLLLKEGHESSRKYIQLWDDLFAGKTVEGELERKRKDGEVLWLYGTFYPVLDKNRNLERIIHIVTDITEQKKQAEKLEAVRLEQEALIEQMQMQAEVVLQAQQEAKAQQQEAEKLNKKLIANEAVLKKALEKAKKEKEAWHSREAELLEIIEKLKPKT
jgi:PAS domain S-box-containing protein